MNKTLIAALSATLTATTLNTFNAVADQMPSGVTLSPGIGYYFYDSDRNLDDERLVSLALGYQFSSPWAIELLYLNADTDAENGSDVDVNQWRLDALYHYKRNGNWQPYAALGVGSMETEPVNSEQDESIVNLGGGVKYLMTTALSLRSDLRLINSLDNEMNDVALTFGISYIFGQTTSKSKPVARIVQAVDTDNDGIKDDRDNCPNTVANVAVDSMGCALDSDNDGVANTIDRCPNSSAGAKVDSVGCYQVLAQTREVQLSINFANNSEQVQQADYAEIEAVATFMTQFAQTEVVIEGHTDSRGKADYNKQLSERRAAAVARVLVNEFGISKGRVSSIGYGEERPLVNNDTNERRAQNRRVVAVVKATAEFIAR